MRVRFIDAVKKVQSAASSYFNVAPEYSVLAAAGVTQGAFSANEPNKNPESVPMKSTKQDAAPSSSNYVLNRLKECATSHKPQPEIFVALLQKQELNQEQVKALAVDLAKNGKARELDALAAKHNLSQEAVTDLIRQQQNARLYQSLLEEQDNLGKLGFLFDPKSPVTVVEASDQDAILNATLAAKNANTPKHIVEVDTTEAYEPKFQERVLQSNGFAKQQGLFNKSATMKRSSPAEVSSTSPLYNATNIAANRRYQSAVRNHY